MRFKSGIIGFIVIAVISCNGEKANTGREITRPVSIMTVESPDAINKIYTGVVEAEEYSKLAFKVSGPLVEMRVDAGEKVRKGSIVAAVDPLDYKLKSEASKAAYVTAGSQLQRNKKLLEMQAISKQEYEVSEANYIRAKSDYEAAADNLESTTLRAPFDGFVEKKYVENYQKVQPGEPVIQLVNPDKLRVAFILPETSVGLMRLPVKITVEFDTYKGLWFDAKIKEVVDASPDGGGIPVRLIIDDSRFTRDKHNIYPGFSCKVNLRLEEVVPDSYIIPLSAVFKDLLSDETSVWLYDGRTGMVKRQKIAARQLFGNDKILVEQGLKGDDVIVTAGVDFISEGAVVHVLVNKIVE